MIKRAIDLVGALVGLLLLWPLLLLLAILVVLDSGFPVFYRGVRTGLNGEPFRIFKFRTMVPNAESVGGPSTALDDARLTRWGKTFRKYKLDELPQLFNVLSGEMSLVGPRPQVREYTDLYTGEERRILEVKPGLTDFASIEFINLDSLLGNVDVDERYRTEIEPRKNELRLKYVREQSLLTDLQILYRTAVRLLGIRRLWNGGS